ncbi:hypothetical protein V8C86DRAFT_2892286, partial [Haematococcus lacustris]
MPHGWAGLGWAGLGWAGLGWAGLGWAGLGWDTTQQPSSSVSEGGKGQECEHEQFCSVSCLADSLLPPCWLLLYAVYYQSA